MIRDRPTVDANDWGRLHQACRAVDAARVVGGERFGRTADKLADAFGGTYFGPHFEDQGFVGVVRILEGANLIRHDAWHAIHGAARRKNREEGIEVARTAVRTALALHRLYTILDQIGVCSYEPAHTICGITSTIQVTGLRWLAGERLDREEDRVTREAAEAFASGADVAVLLSEAGAAARKECELRQTLGKHRRDCAWCVFHTGESQQRR